MRTLMVSPAFRLKSRFGADEIEDAADEEEAVELDESECSSFGMRWRLSGSEGKESGSARHSRITARWTKVSAGATHFCQSCSET
jgi:hypothetical protein